MLYIRRVASTSEEVRDLLGLLAYFLSLSQSHLMDLQSVIICSTKERKGKERNNI